MSTLNPYAALYAEKVRVRVCGICIHDEKLLLVRHQAPLGKHSFWAPPGGGLAYGETLHQCVIREFKEETGLDVAVSRFLFLNEFVEEPLHAIEFFFEVQLTGGTLLTGTDPEAAPDAQLIEQVTYLTREEINKLPIGQKHRILHYLFSLDDLLGQAHHFLDR